MLGGMITIPEYNKKILFHDPAPGPLTGVPNLLRHHDGIPNRNQIDRKPIVIIRLFCVEEESLRVWCSVADPRKSRPIILAMAVALFLVDCEEIVKLVLGMDLICTSY
jgi:hypothetical protein